MTTSTSTRKTPKAVRTVYSPIVGNIFRMAGKLVLPMLHNGCPLVLEPEPENPYDPDAVKVCVDMHASPNLEEMLKDPDVPLIIHLGYIPRSGTKTDTTGTGTRQVLHIISQPNWSASLIFSPEGRPMARIDAAWRAGTT